MLLLLTPKPLAPKIAKTVIRATGAIVGIAIVTEMAAVTEIETGSVVTEAEIGTRKIKMWTETRR